jgi:hypothetical protein
MKWIHIIQFATLLTLIFALSGISLGLIVYAGGSLELAIRVSSVVLVVSSIATLFFALAATM